MAKDELRVRLRPAPCPECGTNAPLGSCRNSGYLSPEAKAFLDGLAEIIARDILRRVGDGVLALHRAKNGKWLVGRWTRHKLSSTLKADQ